MAVPPEEVELNVPTSHNDKFQNAGLVTRNSGYDYQDHPEIFGTEEDLMLASKKANHLKVFAAFRPPDSSFIIYQGWIFCLPCFWPYALCAFPVLCNAHFDMKHTLYIVTEKSIIVSVMDHSNCCCPCCRTGDDYKEYPIETITSVAVNNTGTGCGCCAEPSVILRLEPVPGEIIKRGKHDKHGHGGRSIVMFVKEADQIADLVRLLKDKIDSVITQQPFSQQPFSQQPQPAKRIFVSKLGSDAVSLVVLNGNTHNDWEQFLEKIRAALGCAENSTIKISLADVNVVITEADQLQSNDKVLIQEIVEEI